MPRTPDAEIKVVGKSGQISLGKAYAGKTLRLDRREDGSIVVTPVTMVPDSQLWTIDEPHRSQIARGLAWSAATPPAETDLETLVKQEQTKRAGRSRGRRR
jgi:hypothetical protein